MRKLPRTNFHIRYYPLQGGDDLITPSLSVDPGRAILTQNYELDMHGRYRLIEGYEAFDGRPSPSDASYWILNYDAGTKTMAEGETVEGDLSGATGVVYAMIVSSGSIAGGTAAGYLVLFGVSGTFQNDENIQIAAVNQAVVNGEAVERGADTDANDSIYLLAAIEDARDAIQAVPGSGDILGFHQYNGVKYAFRNNSGGTAAQMYKSSSSGWTLCDLGRTISFTSGGTHEVLENDTLTGAVSGATAVVKRIILTSGSWADGDAAGTFVLYSQSGTYQSETLNEGANTNVCTIAGDSSETTLQPNGRYEFENKNFGGHAGTLRMYGVNGVNKAFEWDGSVFVPITTGMTTDTPNHIIGHKNHLFLMFPGGSVQSCSTGTPYEWSVVTGASEIGVGDEGTGFMSMPNGLVVFSRNSTNILYGSGNESWYMEPHADEVGAIEWTPQKIGPGVYLDDRGLTSLSATNQYGDFKSNILSKYIDPWLKTKLGEVQSSIRIKEKNQYRLFFSDNRCLTLTIDGNKVIGFTRQLYDKLPVCTCSAENSSGQEELFFGSTDGYVYQLDKGTSFNGNAIVAVTKLHFNHLKTPSNVKRVRRIILELDAPLNTYLSTNVEFDYGEEGNQAEYFELDSTGGVWDVDEWGEFVWDGKSVASAPLDVDGSGKNFSLTIYHSGEWELQADDGDTFTFQFPFAISTAREGITGARPHTIQGYTVHYDIRKVQR